MSKTIEKLEALKKKYELLSENLIDAIWIADAETLKFEYITESIEKLSGYTSDEYLKLSFQERLSSQSFKKVSEILAQEVSKFEEGIKSIKTLEVELIHKTGTLYWGEIKARIYKDESGELKIIGVTKDITKLKAAETGKNELIRKLHDTVAEKDKLLTENKILRGLLPICSGCKRIRDEKGRWWPLDAYVQRSTALELTHTICLDCKEAFYGDEDWYRRHKRKHGKE